jgi:histidinol dehydrogenase
MSTSIPVIRLDSPQGRQVIEKIRTAARTRTAEAQATVENILSEVREKGDKALFDFTHQFDMVRISGKTLRLDPAYIRVKARQAPPAFRKACTEAARRIRAFHEKQKPVSFTVRTKEGKLSQIVKPLTRVGLYVPGGYTMYPSTVLMNAIPAQIAGVGEIAVATPPRGELHPAIAFALDLLGLTEVYRMGGAQAIGAFAFGTQSVRKVDKIVGPGNLYVALAKKAVYGTVDIDSIAGPSEVIVLADASANPDWVALDLCAQAEHGSGDETALCVTEDARYAKKLLRSVETALAQSPVKDVFRKLRLDAMAVCVAKNRKRSIEFINECAPEHLEIMTRTARADLAMIKNAGAVFIGPYSPVAMGDYFAGTNHVLPTGGAARFASGLGVESFVKRMSVAEISKSGLKRSACHVSVLARMENLVHHALSVERRAGSGQ